MRKSHFIKVILIFICIDDSPHINLISIKINLIIRFISVKISFIPFIITFITTLISFKISKIKKNVVPY